MTLPVVTLIILLNTSLAPDRSLEEARQLYNDLYITSTVKQIDWNGSVKKCEAGTLGKDILQKAKDRINYFRLACGLEPITFNDSYNEMCQEAALIMTANGQLSHTPPKSWKCYSEKGFLGAKNANLGISDFTNFQEMAFVTGFILDYGEFNKTVSHRKWLLNSRSVEMGYGNTGAHEAIYVTGVSQDRAKQAPGYIAYPPAGHYPYKLIFEKWSFSIPYGEKADFEKAKVEMYDGNGKKMKVKILSVTDPWYFDPAIVWQAESLFTEDEIKYLKNSLLEKGYVGKEITVKIRNVRINEEIRNFEYKVIPFDPAG